MTTFLNAHKPALTDGEYTVAVNHAINVVDYSVKPNLPKTPSMASNLQFTVNGPRFNLSPSDVHSQFPIDGAKGDFQNFLPYIVFNRSTLPWERTPYNLYDGPASWLFLLVVDEDDVKNGNVTESTKAYTDIDANLALLGIDQSSAGDDKKLIDQGIIINLITINDTIKSYIPSLDSIGLLSYVRIKDNEEQAVVVASRLPAPSKSSVVYLISLENKFDKTSKQLNNSTFVYLKKWKFYTEGEQLYSFGNGNFNKAILSEPTLTAILTADCATDESVYLNFDDFITKALKPEEAKVDHKHRKKVLRHSCKLPGTTFHEILSNLKGGTDYLRTPNIADKPGIAQSGSVTLPWQHKDDKGFVAYDYAQYRGPLVAQLLDLSKATFNKKPRLHPDNPSLLPIFVDPKGFIPADADELKITYNGGIDCTYASAYELGKLTALNDNAFASAFFEWKMNYVSQELSQKQKTNPSHLAVLPSKDPPALPAKLQSKFEEWKLLKALPFRYLVPEPDFFPHESLRIFTIDNYWVNAFICGAFSTGYTPKSAGLSQVLIKLFNSDSNINYGFLLNSIAIKAWPDYELEATAAKRAMNLSTDFKNDLLRKDNLDGSTHIYIFDKQFDSLKFHLHPGKLLPGFMLEDGVYWKHDAIFPDAVDTNRVLKLASIASHFTDRLVPDYVNLMHKYQSPDYNFPATTVPKLTSALFNAWLMEGTPEVMFTFSKNVPG